MKEKIEQTIPVNRIRSNNHSLTVNRLHQIYIVKQMNVCRDYNGNRGEQKHNAKFGVSLGLTSMVEVTDEYSVCCETYFYTTSYMHREVIQTTI